MEMTPDVIWPLPSVSTITFVPAGQPTPSESTAMYAGVPEAVVMSMTADPPTVSTSHPWGSSRINGATTPPGALASRAIALTVNAVAPGWRV
jgi:hypothetical protein